MKLSHNQRNPPLTPLILFCHRYLTGSSREPQSTLTLFYFTSLSSTSFGRFLQNLLSIRQPYRFRRSTLSFEYFDSYHRLRRTVHSYWRIHHCWAQQPTKMLRHIDSIARPQAFTRIGDECIIQSLYDAWSRIREGYQFSLGIARSTIVNTHSDQSI